MARKITSVQQHEQEVQVKEVSAPASPPSGYVYIYAKSDGKLYIKDDTGTETDLTATTGGAAVSSVNSLTGAVTLVGTDASGGAAVPLLHQNLNSGPSDFEIQINGIISSDSSLTITDGGLGSIDLVVPPYVPPDTLQNRSIIGSDTILAAYYTSYVPDSLEIADTITYEIESLSCLEIG